MSETNWIPCYVARIDGHGFEFPDIEGYYRESEKGEPFQVILADALTIDKVSKYALFVDSVPQDVLIEACGNRTRTHERIAYFSYLARFKDELPPDADAPAVGDG